MRHRKKRMIWRYLEVYAYLVFCIIVGKTTFLIYVLICMRNGKFICIYAFFIFCFKSAVVIVVYNIWVGQEALKASWPGF